MEYIGFDVWSISWVYVHCKSGINAVLPTLPHNLQYGYELIVFTLFDSVM